MADYSQLTKRLLALGGMYGTEGARPTFGGGWQAVNENYRPGELRPLPGDTPIVRWAMKNGFSTWDIKAMQDLQKQHGLSDDQVKYQLMLSKQTE